MTETTYTIRPADDGDEAFLTEMVCVAAAWRPSSPRLSVDDVRSRPELDRYVQGWGRAGDVGFIAEAPADVRLGAAWFRLFSPTEPGFGFIDARTPELSLAVIERARGRGIGTALLRALVGEARAQGFAAVSLSVEQENAAVALYEREGFERVWADEHTWTMRRPLEPR